MDTQTPQACAGPQSPSSQSKRALTAKYVFDGSKLNEETVVVIENQKITHLLTLREAAEQGLTQIEDLGADVVLTCGLMDCQMNGAGGKQFNDDISLSTIETLREVAFKHGTTSFLPSMISATFEDVQKSLQIVKQWVDLYGLDYGVVGIHLEGPFLSVEKKGIHEESLLQIASRDKLEIIVGFGKHFPIMMTVAPEAVSLEDVKYLSDNGIILSLGHSNATYEVAMDFFNAGASAVTHLYNAMSGLAGRAPGVIGAVLNNPTCYTAIIPDLYHVHPANVEIAARLKPEHLFFVTDCHAPVGSDLKEFTLTGRHMYVAEGRCVDKDGHLCGSYILMDDALRNAVSKCGISLEMALKMATVTPNKAMRIDGGRLKVGMSAHQVVAVNMKDFKCTVVQERVVKIE